MPVLIWGPMNQVEGLRETIALAIRLNRTIVIPPMYRHFTDPNGPNGIVDPEIRIDIPSVRKLISTVSYKNLPATLSPDNILVARSLGLEEENPTAGVISGSRASRLRRFETATGFEVGFAVKPYNLYRIYSQLEKLTFDYGCVNKITSKSRIQF